MKEEVFLCALRGGDLTSAVCSLQECGDNQPSSEVPWLQAKLLQLGLADHGLDAGVQALVEFTEGLSQCVSERIAERLECLLWRLGV